MTTLLLRRNHSTNQKEQEGEKNDVPAIIKIPDAIVIGQPEAIPSIQKLGDQTFITPSTTYFIQDGAVERPPALEKRLKVDRARFARTIAT